MLSSPRHNEFTMLTEFVSAGLVRFENMKTKYYVDEDITVEYVLTQIRPSSRNWVGLFPRGCNNLQEYITFEWTICCPKDQSSTRHKTTFFAKYHSQSICFKKEYQFLYINKQMKVLGTSPFFYFLQDKNISNEETQEHTSTSKDFCSSSQEFKPQQTFNPLASYLAIPQSCGSMMMSPVNHKQLWNENHQRLSTPASIPLNSAVKGLSRGYASEITLTTPDMPAFINTNGTNGMLTCTHCKRPTDFVRVQQALTGKIKSVAEHARTLESRIRELERDLEMSQVAQKKMKLAVQHSKHERMAYQKFVNEMLIALSQKGVVRVIDGQGTEMLLKRVVNAKLSVDDRSQSVTKTSHRERLLKAVIGSQEQTIRDLLMRIESNSKENISTPLKNYSSDLIDFDVPYDSNLTVANMNNTLNNLKKCMVPTSEEESSDSIHPQTDTVSNNRNTEQDSEEHDELCTLLNETYSINKIVDEREELQLAGMVVEAVVHAPHLDETFDLPLSEENKESLQRKRVMEELIKVINKRQKESTQVEGGGEPDVTVEQAEQQPPNAVEPSNAEIGTALVIKDFEDFIYCPNTETLNNKAMFEYLPFSPV